MFNQEIPLKEVSKETFRDLVEETRAYAEVSDYEVDDSVMVTYYITPMTAECVGCIKVTDDGFEYYIPDLEEGITMEEAMDLIYGA